MLGLARVLFNLFTDLIDEHMEVGQFVSVVRPPNGLQKLGVSNRRVRMSSQIVEQVEFLRREPHVFAGDRDISTFPKRLGAGPLEVR